MVFLKDFFEKVDKKKNPEKKVCKITQYAAKKDRAGPSSLVDRRVDS